MKRIALCSLVAITMCAGAAAQFDQFEWTLEKHGPVTTALGPDVMYFDGHHGDPPGTVAIYKTSSPVAGRVSVDTDFWIEELVCGSANAMYVLGNQVQNFSNCSYFDPIILDVDEGQTFGFGMKINNGSWSASLGLSNFTFTPCWTALGGALAGSAGTPSLEGHGLLAADHSFHVDLVDAKPSASVAVVVGFSQLDVPFKGGVLVPAVDALLTGLVTDAGGQLSLVSTWPAGVPAGFEFVLQGWIADSAGPQGYAASNAVKAFAP